MLELCAFSMNSTLRFQKSFLYEEYPFVITTELLQNHMIASILLLPLT